MPPRTKPARARIRENSSAAARGCPPVRFGSVRFSSVQSPSGALELLRRADPARRPRFTGGSGGGDGDGAGAEAAGGMESPAAAAARERGEEGGEGGEGECARHADARRGKVTGAAFPKMPSLAGPNCEPRHRSRHATSSRRPPDVPSVPVRSGPVRSVPSPSNGNSFRRLKGKRVDQNPAIITWLTEARWLAIVSSRSRLATSASFPLVPLARLSYWRYGAGALRRDLKAQAHASLDS
ncbi:hypothetical protein NL676_027940 [Syzygium grande]|nr:hypothetical protein NL676_027940 [Syzygium grande]